jgi:hypothetical protein
MGKTGGYGLGFRMENKENREEEIELLEDHKVIA